MIKVTGNIQTKNGKLYALLNYKDENGKRKVKWISTGLAEKDNKRKAQRMLPEIILKFEEELEAQNEKGSDKQDFIQFLYGEKNSTLVEFKLASNTKLKNNLANQIDAYKSASNTKRAIKVILFFSLKEEQKVISILNELKIIGSKDIILIDARNDNKPSASNIK